MPSDISSGELPAAQGYFPDQGLRVRIAGHSVIEKLLADRIDLPRRSLIARIFGVDPLTTENYPWYKGALGEIAVGSILERLGPEWTVLHAVPVGAGTSDIDHVVIGPAGVFTLNTKNHAGQPVWVAGRTFMVAGKKQRHLYTAAHEAARAGKLLSRAVKGPISATGIVVVVNPKSLTIREKSSDVVVLRHRQLLHWLSTRPTVFTERQVQWLAAAAALPGTWHRNPPAAAEPALLRQGFSELATAVERARRRRLGWVLALLVGAPLVLLNLSRFVG